MLLTGLASGVVLTALYFGMQKDQGDGFGSGLKALLDKQSTPATTAAPSRGQVTKRAPAQKPELDFYTVLPEIERVMPESDFRLESDATDRKTYTYILQAASYRSYQDADRLKARLALAGLEAAVQKVSVEGKGVYYRVRMGPYTSKRTLKNVRQQLSKLGVHAIALRLSDD